MILTLESLLHAGMSCVIHTPEGSFEALVPMPGRHMVYNALAGTAVGIIFGLSTEEIRRGIENCTPVAGRFNVTRTGKCTVIDDCYNANPASMEAALKTLSQTDRRRVAILGDMAELGKDEIAYHSDRYYNMDAVVRSALNLFEEKLAK